MACCNSSALPGPLLAACSELSLGLSGALDMDVPLNYGCFDDASGIDGTMGVVSVATSSADGERSVRLHASPLADEAFSWAPAPAPSASSSCGAGAPSCLELSSPTGRGALFGVFRLLAAVRRGSFSSAALADAPRVPLRMWQLWDNLDGTIERGYAGASVFHWDELPGIVRDNRQRSTSIVAALRE